MHTRSGLLTNTGTRLLAALAVLIATGALIFTGGATPAKAASVGVVSFAQVSYSVTEGQQIQIGLTRTGSTAGAQVCIQLAAGGSAPNGDYSPTNLAVFFATGVSTESFTFTAVQDPTTIATNSGSRTVIYQFTASPCLGDTYTTSGILSVTITINDDDGAPTYSLGTSTFSVLESAGTLTIPITRSGIKTATDTVHCVVSLGTAQAGDITGTTLDQLITFAPTETTQNCSITIVNDVTPENPNETVAVTLGTPSTGFAAGAIEAATVTIVDDDGPGVLLLKYL